MVLRIIGIFISLTVVAVAIADPNPANGTGVFVVPKDQPLKGLRFDLSKLAIVMIQQQKNIVKAKSLVHFNTPEAQKRISKATLIGSKNSYQAKLIAPPKKVPTVSPDTPKTYEYVYRSSQENVESINYIILHSAKVNEIQPLEKADTKLDAESLIKKWLAEDWTPANHDEEKLHTLKKIDGKDQYKVSFNLKSNLKNHNFKPNELIFSSKDCIPRSYGPFSTIKCGSISFLSEGDLLIDIDQAGGAIPRTTLKVEDKPHLFLTMEGGPYVALEKKDGKWIKSKEVEFFNEPD